jgi:hypothetical protein
LGAGHRLGPFERARAWGGPAAVTARLGDLRGFGPRFEPPPGLADPTGRRGEPGSREG